MAKRSGGAGKKLPAAGTIYIYTGHYIDETAFSYEYTYVRARTHTPTVKYTRERERESRMMRNIRGGVSIDQPANRISISALARSRSDFISPLARVRARLSLYTHVYLYMYTVYVYTYSRTARKLAAPHERRRFSRIGAAVAAAISL